MLRLLSQSPKFNLLRKTAFAIALCIIYYLAFTSIDYQIQSTFNDKVNHALAFSILAMSAHLAFQQWTNKQTFLFLIGYGLSIEIVQFFLPWRSFSLLDLVADSLGICLYLFGFKILVIKYLLAVPAHSSFEKAS